jgi:4-amino-4-deoxy-L-arabinose transferase-like glycosyltransferase
MKKIILPLFFVGVVFFLFFFRIGDIPLWSSDEGRYGEIARAMWESKDFVVPRFNGVDYLDKPVLAPLFTSLAYGLFGVNAFATRFIPVLAGLLGILATWFFAKKLTDKNTANYAAVLLSATIGYVLVGRFAVIDMLMTLWLTLSLFCLLSAYITRKGRYYLWAYLFMGLGFMTKGLIGFVLPGLTYFAFLTWRRELGEIRHMKIGWGILIIFLVILPWCIAMHFRNPSFLHTFFIDQQFGRFVTGSYGRKKPFWFFIPILFATSFPWSLFLPSAVIRGLQKDNPRQRIVQFLICWIAVILVFFSIPKSKLPYYLLPVSAAVATLLACLFSSWTDIALIAEREKKLLRMTVASLAVLCGIAFVGLNITFLFWKRFPEIEPLRPVLFAGTLLLAAGGMAAWFFVKSGSFRKVIGALTLMIYLSLVLTVFGMQKITPYQSTVLYAETLKGMLREGDKVCVFASPDNFSDLSFHLRKRIVIAGSDQGTLALESKKLSPQEYAQWFIYAEPFVELFNKRSQRIFCLTKEKKMKELEGLGLKNYRVIKRDHGKVLFTNVP